MTPASIHTAVISRDAYDWLALWSTVIAAGLALAALVAALIAIWRGNNIAREADAALARERRITFELDVLARIAQSAGYYQAGSGNVVRALVRLLPEDELTGLRAAVNSDTLPSADLLASHWSEYERAVDLRRNLRNPPRGGLIRVRLSRTEALGIWLRARWSQWHDRESA